MITLALNRKTQSGSLVREPIGVNEEGRKVIREGFLEEVGFDLVSKGKNPGMQREEFEVKRDLSFSAKIVQHIQSYVYFI